MNVLRTCLLLLGTAIIQAIGSNYLPSIMYLDLPLIVTIYYSLQGRKLYGVMVGSLAGLTQDALSGIPLGINGFSKTLLGYTATVINRKIVLENSTSQFIVLLFSSIANAGLTLMLFVLIGRQFSLTFIKQAALQAVITAVFGLLLLRLLNRKSPLSNRFKAKVMKYESEQR